MVSRTEHQADREMLQELLLRCCRPDDGGRKSIPKLADQLGLANYTIYKWLKAVSVPHWRASQLVENSGGEVTLDEFIPFVFSSR